MSKRRAAWSTTIIGFLLSSMGVPIQAQQLPPIFATTPRKIVAAKTIAEFPVNTFLENIVVNKDGILFVTSYEDGTIHRISPAGVKSAFAKISGNIAGIAFDGRENLIVSGVTDQKAAAVFRVNRKGQVETLAIIKGALFLNGVVHLSGERFLIADSYKGAIWEFNAKTRKYTVWLTDTALARSDTKNPTPAVNGLKISGKSLYVTNTQTQKIFRIPVTASGKAGKPRLFVAGINGDDFAFDAGGNLFVTTHIYNNVVRVAPNGKMTIIAEAAQGVTGDTALAFGRTKHDRNAIYVVTNGGMSFPPSGGVQKAKVVRLEVGTVGAKP